MDPEKWIRQNILMGGWLIPALILCSCAQAATPVQPVPSPIPPGPFPTLTPASLSPIETGPDQQRYTDPDGWFSVNIPAGWKSEGGGLFSGEDGFFETGYLPEMMFMQHAVDVCQWLANIDSDSTYHIISPTPLSKKAENCTLTTLPGITPSSVQAVIEIPQADEGHRFFYIKADAGDFEEIIGTFAWLRPVDPYREPSVQAMPLRPEDASFWENTRCMPPELSVKEYELAQEAQNASPSELIFPGYLPPDVPPMESRTESDSDASHGELDMNTQLASFGYELRTDPTGKAQPQLFRDGKLLFDDVYKIPGVYTFQTSSGPVLAFVVETAKQGVFNSHLVQNDSITEWGPAFNDPAFAPVLHEGELLWVRAAENSYVQVQSGDREVIFSFATYFGTRLPVNRFYGWNDGWILEIGNFLIEDGEILNEKFGFEEAFGWRVVNGKPFYFFRKGQRVGMSYAGEFLPLYYDEIAHGFCCGFAANNPTGHGDSVRFFGKRSGTWYYAIVEVE